jgi:hypothetical protein
MDTPNVSRDALLDDPRFWCLLYEPWLKPCVGDPFEEGEEYFFSIRENTVDDLFHELEGMALEAKREYAMPPAYEKTYLHHVPIVSILVSLANGWRAGVDLVMCPDDFAFDYVVVPPSGEHLVIGVHGGNHSLPALRWEEVLFLGSAARPTATVSGARSLLLFYPACFPEAVQQNAVRAVLRQAWGEVGFPVQHLEEWIDRTTDRCPDHALWRRDATYGWICEDDHSLRNPRLLGKYHRVVAGLFPAVARLFSSL